MTQKNHIEITGRAWSFGDNVDTDQIMPAKYLTLKTAEEMGRHIMESVDPEWPQRIKAGDIVVGGWNFGCGSSREHAPLGLKGAGVACVVARSFARIFYRNAVNIGLPLLIVPEGLPPLDQGAEITIDLDAGRIRLGKDGPEISGKAPSDIVRAIVAAGGLMRYVSEKAGRPG